MKVVYIAGPYRSSSGINGIYQNIQNAWRYALKYWEYGYAVICPHTNTGLMDGIDTDDMFLNGDKEILSRCDVIVMIPGWKKSEGAKEELRVAKKLGLRVVYEKE